MSREVLERGLEQLLPLALQPGGRLAEVEVVGNRGADEAQAARLALGLLLRRTTAPATGFGELAVVVALDLGLVERRLVLGERS